MTRLVLTLACLVSTASLLPAEPTTQPTSQPAASPAAEKVDANRFDALRADKEAVILDVRMPGEFEAGHIAGATNLPWGGFYEEAFNKAIKELDPSKTYLIHCASGKRSALAGARMKELGIKNVYDLDGGIRAWTKAGKPVEK